MTSIPLNILKHQSYIFEKVIPCKYNGFKINNIKVSISFEDETEKEYKLSSYCELFKTHIYYEV